jgi:hexosaminidase
VLKVLDQMAAYKLNTLHMHLADDEGWRLEIPGLPELTDLGAKRCHDLEDRTCLLPQLGSGPDDDTSGSGFLKRSDFVEIVAAARARNIEIIPEFDMPGHARAAIKSMEARARKGDTGYLLSDPDDASQYLSIQYYNDNAINACRESTYAFVAKVMDEVRAMFVAGGSTLKTWHIGGDEVGAGAWTASPICNALYASGGPVASANDVHGYFIRRVNSLAQARGFAVRGWSDGLRKSVTLPDGSVGKVFLDPASDLNGNPVSANWWGTLFWWDNSAYTLANAGYKVILTSPDFLYLDHPYEADPKERGYYWATRFTSVKKLFSYISGNLPSNAQISKDRMGGDYTGAFAGIANLDHPENVIGLEGPQWGETMRTDDQVDYMVFPRMLALAERAWHRAAWEPADGNDVAATIDLTGLAADWERFANVVGHKELPKLGSVGVAYRVEVPGGVIQNGQLAANVALPGLSIQYKDAKGKWQAFDANSPPQVASTEIRAVTSDGRAGRSVSVP